MGPRRRFPVFLLVLAVTPLAGCHDSNGSGGGPDGITNLELAAVHAETAPGILAFLVEEVFQGLDLNGDGDLGDRVVHVHEERTGVTTNLGYAAIVFLADRRCVAFDVSEAAQGATDLNGDGDTDDRVLFLHSLDTGLTTSTGLSVRTDVVLRDGHLAFRVDEASSAGMDLNGDGDAEDAVVHVLDTSTLVTTNLGLDALNKIELAGEHLSFLTSENGGTVQDLNGDGDTLDHVLHVHDVVAGVTTNIELAVRVAGDPSFAPADVLATETIIAFAVLEAEQANTDLNGDGDTLDAVLHVHHPQTGLTRNTGVAAATLDYLPGRDYVAIPVSEGDQGSSDANGDGDTLDSVLNLYDASLVASGLGLAALRIEGGDRHVVFDVREAFQGGADLNGDGDALDRVLHVLDVVTGTVSNLGLADSQRLIVGRFLVFNVIESEQGATDLNGDGDTDDAVAHVYDLNLGTVRNVGLHCFLLGAYGSRAALSVQEEGQVADLNGDGDMLDLILHDLDPETGDVRNLRLAGLGFGSGGAVQGVASSTLPFLVSERDQGATDLNGDGDALDSVLHAVVFPGYMAASDESGSGSPEASISSPTR
jgi:hypothetical protein